MGIRRWIVVASLLAIAALSGCLGPGVDPPASGGAGGLGGVGGIGGLGGTGGSGGVSGTGGVGGFGGFGGSGGSGGAMDASVQDGGFDLDAGRDDASDEDAGN